VGRGRAGSQGSADCFYYFDDCLCQPTLITNSECVVQKGANFGVNAQQVSVSIGGAEMTNVQIQVRVGVPVSA
jgi:hypothetical protein